MSIRVRVVGTGALATRLAHMRQEMQGRLTEAMNISVRDVQEKARADHRFMTRTGEAERSIATEVKGRGMNVTGTVGTTRLITIYLHQGTKPHTIVPRSKQVLRWPTGSGFQFAKRVQHPGTKKDPFVLNAADAEEPRIVSRFDRIFDELG